ncbi:hypothetical protein J1605_001542 [Eschrichtius robustus]|uniref:Uncharacterized protein n=1 Tax=Eschrichtius robustus TaxID=9764 RepID=A0AB34I1J9_ESCRO|nr:hypothetical protein J1605_001542 [Eschrichtius robustus]
MERKTLHQRPPTPRLWTGTGNANPDAWGRVGGRPGARTAPRPRLSAGSGLRRFPQTRIPAPPPTELFVPSRLGRRRRRSFHLSGVSRTPPPRDARSCRCVAKASPAEREPRPACRTAPARRGACAVGRPGPAEALGLEEPSWSAG